MIAHALDFITQQLEDFFKRKTLVRDSFIKLSGLVTPEGGISVTAANTLVISVVNIAEESSIANRPRVTEHGGALLKRPVPIYLNVYILISALFKEDQYEEGLHWLSLAINFFQQHACFNAAQVQMPQGIDKLSFELVNLDIDNMGRFWGALGARYQPSVIYKMRMLTINENTMEAVLPKIRESIVTATHQ